jgi:hypothetical protein
MVSRANGDDAFQIGNARMREPRLNEKLEQRAEVNGITDQDSQKRTAGEEDRKDSEAKFRD